MISTAPVLHLSVNMASYVHIKIPRICLVWLNGNSYLHLFKQGDHTISK